MSNQLGGIKWRTTKGRLIPSLEQGNRITLSLPVLILVCLQNRAREREWLTRVVFTLSNITMVEGRRDRVALGLKGVRATLQPVELCTSHDCKRPRRFVVFLSSNVVKKNSTWFLLEWLEFLRWWDGTFNHQVWITLLWVFFSTAVDAGSVSILFEHR